MIQEVLIDLPAPSHDAMLSALSAERQVLCCPVYVFRCEFRMHLQCLRESALHFHIADVTFLFLPHSARRQQMQTMASREGGRERD